MRILTLNTSDTGGGAEGIARRVAEALRADGHEVLWAVGRKRSSDEWVIDLQAGARPGPSLTRFLMRHEGRVKGAGLALRALTAVARPRNYLRWRCGLDPYDFPEVERVFRAFKPDLVFCHNLHGSGLGGRPYMGYFDLSALARWSQSVPVCLVMHDAWLLSGHCAHSLDCARRQTGCGSCPYLHNPPAYVKDGTAGNWALKKDVFARSRLAVAAPSQWMLDMVRSSILQPGASELRCIPNGVDTGRFRPSDRAAAKHALGLPNDARVLLFLSNGAGNPYKGFAPAHNVFQRVRESHSGRTMLLVGGVRTGDRLPDDPDVCAVTASKDPDEIVKLYNAADVYLHTAVADTHPLTVLEAMACGTPVVASRVGGIPEQVDDGRTGFLAAPGDTAATADAVLRLLKSPDLATQIGAAARAEAERRFDVAHMLAGYREWIADLMRQEPKQQAGVPRQRPVAWNPPRRGLR
jgi:glycosyltransferase involved in cell wall biosynthesis